MNPDLHLLVTLLQPAVGAFPASLLRVALLITDETARKYERDNDIDDILNPMHLRKFLPYHCRKYQIVEVTRIFSVSVDAQPHEWEDACSQQP